jgi:beta-glucosidase-like glycosyl hydrolase
VLFSAFAQAFAAALGLTGPPAPDPASALSPLEKARLVVVSGLPAPEGVGGVIVQRWSIGEPRPGDALVMVDQEGGETSAFEDAPPLRAAAGYGSEAEALAEGRATGRALRQRGVDVDLAPVLDAPSGPLGSRHFRRPELGLSFARGLEEGGVAACVKHFPGLGSAAISTDLRPYVPARLLPGELHAFRAAVDAGVQCVMTSHAVYRAYGPRRAVVSPGVYATLRRWGFDGVVVTDSLNVISGGDWSSRWAVGAARAGADLLLFTSPEHARRAIRALLPLARRGELDEAVRRVLEFRAERGLTPP